MISDFDYQAMGSRIRECRCERGLTQEELAEKACVSTSFIGHIERAEKQPSLETIVRLSQCLAVSIDYLALGRKGHCNPIGCSLRYDLQKLVEAYPARTNE